MNTWNKRNFRHIKNDIFDNIVVVLIVGIMLLICGVLVFAGIKNERNRISTGTVIFKDYTPASRTNDSYRAEHFSLTICGEKNGEYVEYTFAVPESEYVMYNVGDRYPRER